MYETRWWPMFHYRSYAGISRVILNLCNVLCYCRHTNYVKVQMLYASQLASVVHYSHLILVKPHHSMQH